MGTHILAIKDMAGLCKPYAAQALVKALRDEVDVPIHFHTHDTSGINAASILRAADAGVDIVDAALASMSGMTSQPNLNSIVAALQNTPRDTGLDLDGTQSAQRLLGSRPRALLPVRRGLQRPTAEVYHHEMPGGQYTNLRQQAKSTGPRGPLARDRRHLRGGEPALRRHRQGDAVEQGRRRPGPVHGDQRPVAPDVLVRRTDSSSFPRSVVEMMQGYLGQPEGGWPKVLQKIILDSGAGEADQGPAWREAAEGRFRGGAGRSWRRRRSRRSRATRTCCRYLLYPQVFLDFAEASRQYDNTQRDPDAGVLLRPAARRRDRRRDRAGQDADHQVPDHRRADEDGTRTVFFELNGQPREVQRRRSLARGDAAAAPQGRRRRPEPRRRADARQGDERRREEGPGVKAGERLLTIEAMKMETAVYSPRDATVADVQVKVGAIVEARDLLVVLQ